VARTCGLTLRNPAVPGRRDGKRPVHLYLPGNHEEGDTV
jgi:hypothetical protein